MKPTKTALPVTWFLQIVYTLLIGLNFLCTWMFDMGVPYVYPFAIVGQFLLFVFPVELFCLIGNVICLIRDAKTEPRPPKMTIRVAVTIGLFVFICVLKALLWNYGQILAGMV